MECKNHKDKKSTNTCNICGQWFCEECVIEINGRLYCKSCLKNKISKEEFKDTKLKSTIDKNPNDLLTLLFSLIPGFGQMYLGFIKRGIFIFILFILFSFNWLQPLNFVVWAFSLFDAIKVKSDFQKGIYIEDDIQDIKKFFKENIMLLLIVLCVITIPKIFNYIRYFLRDLRCLNLLSNHYLIIFIIFIFIIFLIIKYYNNNKSNK